MKLNGDVSGHYGSRLVQVLTTVALLMTCCGCPPAPPSREQQRQADTAHWITVECDDPERAAEGCLDEADLKAISEQVPTISTAVAEKVRAGRVESGGVQADVQICETSPEYFRLVEEAAGVRVLQGRFLESVDFQSGAKIAVLSERLTKRLFPNSDPVGQTIVLDKQELTVVGVVSNGASWGKALTRDVYVPSGFSETGNETIASALFDRFRFRVERVDQVENTQEVIQNIVERRFAGRGVRIRTFVGANK